MKTILMKKPLTLAIAASLGSLSVSYAQQTTETQATTSEEQLQTVEVVGKQDSYFEDTNTTALKGDFLDSETPYQVSTVNQQLIEDVRAERIDDVMNYTTGVTRSHFLANGFVIRGNSLDLQNIKVDGMSGIASRWSSPSTANIEKIEVLKGPASVLYGNMETGGVINIESKLPQSEFGGSFQISAQTYSTDVSDFGDDNGMTGTLDVTGPLRDDLFYRFIATGENINSFRGDVNNENYHIYPSLLWEIDGSNSLLLSLEATKENGSIDHGLAAVDQDINTVASIDTVYQEAGDYIIDEGIALDAHYTRDFDDGAFHFKWRSVWHNDEYKLYESNRVNSDGQDSTLRRRARDQYNERDWHSFDTYLNKHFVIGTTEHDVTVGLAGEYRLTDFDRRAFGGYVSPNISIYNPEYGVGTATATPGNHRETEYHSAGLYAQDKVALTDALTVVGSARINRTEIDFTCLRDPCVRESNTAKTTDFVGSLGAVYNLTDSFSIYANVAQSFEPYTAERTDANGDPLDAEKSLQFETGIKYGIGDNLNATLSVYQIDKDNVSQSLGSGNYELIGEVESQGVELDVQWLPTENWQIKAGYAYNDSYATEGNNDGLRTPFAPRNSAYAFTRYNLPQRLWGGEVGFSLGVTYRDEIKTDISPSNSVTLPAYTLLDLGAYYEINDWKWALNVENATDRKYFYAGSDDERIYVGDPRKVTLTLTKKF